MVVNYSGRDIEIFFINSKKAAKDMLEQVQKKQADAMFDSVQKADSRYSGVVQLDPETQRQLEEAQQYQ